MKRNNGTGVNDEVTFLAPGDLSIQLRKLKEKGVSMQVKKGGRKWFFD